MEDFDAYRAMCANRIRRLERYKKARSFCNLEFDEEFVAKSEEKMESTPSSSSSPPPTAEPTHDAESPSPSTFDLIREKMFSLMENDMSLLQQLLTLGDQINEMKKRDLRRTVSTGSVDYEEEEEKEDHFDEGFSASMSAVTTLYVDDERPQFFSRQNSVLRIPIPPRSSNRFGPRRVIRRPSDVIRHSNARNLHVNSDDTGSESSDGAQSPAGTISSVKSSALSTVSVSYSNSNASTASLPTKKNRSSNSSIDSGIRDENSPSPTFEREVA